MDNVKVNLVEWCCLLSEKQCITDNTKLKERERVKERGQREKEERQREGEIDRE